MQHEPAGIEARDGQAGPKHDRLTALALPLPLALFDVIGVTMIVAESGRCSTDCTGGVLLLLVAPTVRPLTAIGFAEDASSPGAVLVVFALLAVLALTIAWWAYAGRALTDIGRNSLASFSRARWWGMYAALFAALLVLKIVVLAINGTNEGLGLLVEVGLWVLLLRTLARWHRPLDRRPS